jgi:hypothetical protein
MAKAYDDQLCINHCPIDTCDDEHPRCLYRIWRQGETDAKRVAINEACRRWRNKYPERQAAASMNWKRANRERTNELNRQYRARKKHERAQT